MSRYIELNLGPTVENVIDIIHMNIWSIRNKLEFLNSFLHYSDIACFTETPLDEKVLDEDLESRWI